MLHKCWLYQIGPTGGIHFIYQVHGKFRRCGFIVHVHEKIQFFQSFLKPILHSFYLFVGTGKIGWVQAVAYIADKHFGYRKIHVGKIAAAGSVGNYGTGV